jgi:hypothetical protein
MALLIIKNFDAATLKKIVIPAEISAFRPAGMTTYDKQIFHIAMQPRCCFAVIASRGAAVVAGGALS